MRCPGRTSPHPPTLFACGADAACRAGEGRPGGSGGDFLASQARGRAPSSPGSHHWHLSCTDIDRQYWVSTSPCSSCGTRAICDDLGSSPHSGYEATARGLCAPSPRALPVRVCALHKRGLGVRRADLRDHAVVLLLRVAGVSFERVLPCPDPMSDGRRRLLLRVRLHADRSGRAVGAAGPVVPLFGDRPSGLSLGTTVRYIASTGNDRPPLFR
jgi:hypothetical protein